MKGRRGVLVDHPVPIGVGSDDVVLFNSSSNKIGIALGNPTEKVAVRFHRLALEKIEHAMGASFDALLPIRPAIPRGDGIEVRDVVVVFYIDREDVFRLGANGQTSV